MIVEFEWDLFKEQINIKKPGYTFSEAVEAFVTIGLKSQIQEFLL